MGLNLSDQQETQLQWLYEHLLEVNRHTNLTRITALDDFLHRHLLDSLTLAPFLPAGAKVADIGSGAGFPALPLAIARPDIQVIAVESVGKKCAFIRACAEKLNLSGLTVLNQRSEDMGQDPQFREQFDIVTARAVAALPSLLELCLPLVKVGGAFLSMKGLSYETELAAAENALKMLGGELKEVKTFVHPSLSGSRLLIIHKVQSTPAKYPRGVGLPVKNPL